VTAREKLSLHSGASADPPPTIGSGQEAALAYGVTMAIYTARARGTSASSLKEITDQLIQSLQSANPNMRLRGDQRQVRVGGQTALSMTFSNDSPAGGRETDWLVTMRRPEGLAYFIFVAPEQEFGDYQRTFQQIVNSIDFSSR